MSWIKKLSLALLLIVLSLVGTTVTLLSTEGGLHFLLKRAVGWVPGLQMASVSGGWQDLRLKGIEYQMPGMIVKTGQLDLSLQFSCLKNKEISINALTAQDVVVMINSKALPVSDPDPADKPLTDLRMPYPIILKLLALNRVKITVDNQTISLEALRTASRWQQRSLSLMPTQINGLLVSSTLPPVEKSVSPKKHEAPLPQISLVKHLQTFFATPLLPNLPDFSLPLDIQIKEILAEQIRIKGNQDVFITHFLLKGSTQGQQVQLDDLQIKSPQGELSAKGNLTLAGKWPLDIVANSTLNIAPLKEEKIKLKLAGNLRGQLALALNLSGSLSAKLTAITQLSEIGLPLSATLQSQQLRWPLTGDKQYQLNNFNMRFDGKMTDYALSLRFDFQGLDLPSAQFTLEGKGDLAQFDLTSLNLAALQGNANLSGRVDWRNAINWHQILTVSGINTEKEWPAWPAKLDGKITTQGSVSRDGHWQMQIPELILNGNIKQKQLTAQGAISGNSAGKWHVPAINLALGRNTLNIKGDLDKNWGLEASLYAPELNGALPGLSGVAKGVVKLRGSLKTPQVLADISAHGLQWQKLSIKGVKIKGNLHLEERMQSQLIIQIEQLEQENFAISGLTLTAKGSEKQHQLHLTLAGHPMAGQLVLNGRFDRQQQRWWGNLSDTYVDTPVGEWRLNRVITLEYLNMPQKLTIGSHCWQHANAELCAPGRIEIGESGEAYVLLKRFDLAMMKPFLGSDTLLSGIFTGRGDISWQADDTLAQFDMALVGHRVKVQQRIQSNLVPIAFDTLNLNAGLKKGNSQIDSLIKLTDNGQLDGQLKIEQPQRQRNLSGNITVSDFSLAMLNPILSYGETASGVLNSKLRLAGNANNPLLYEKLALDKIGFDGSWMPFKINESRLLMNFNGMTLTLEGLIRTAQGQLNLIGEADWRTPDAWHAKVTAKGDKLRVTMPPMLQADVSPDLAFLASPQSLKLEGQVNIPWARVLIEKMPDDVVAISSDEVMLNNKLQPIAKRNTAMAIQTNLNIVLGSDVRIDAFGLQAQLEGTLKMVQDKRGLGLHGQITIPQGSFHAYGQDLIVKKGELLFSGPADQPLLNIDAIRNPETTENKVTAGVLVTGMANAPRVDVYSYPAMSQQEALSYLLQGQGLTNSGADGGMMTSMLIGIGVAKSGKLVGKIGEAFGVSNLTLDTEGVGNSSKVVVSGNVTKNLQVKYGVGIFDSLAALTLRYQLMPKLYLEAVSGINQTLDMLYQFEF